MAASKKKTVKASDEKASTSTTAASEDSAASTTEVAKPKELTVVEGKEIDKRPCVLVCPVALILTIFGLVSAGAAILPVNAAFVWCS